VASHAPPEASPLWGGRRGHGAFPVGIRARRLPASRRFGSPAAGGARRLGDVPSLGSISHQRCWRASRSLAGLVGCAAGALLLSLPPTAPEDEPENVISDPCAPGGCMHRVLGCSSRGRKLIAAKDSASHPSCL